MAPLIILDAMKAREAVLKTLEGGAFGVEAGEMGAVLKATSGDAALEYTYKNIWYDDPNRWQTRMATTPARNGSNECTACAPGAKDADPGAGIVRDRTY